MEEISGEISLRQMEYLVAVHDLGSLSAAATRLHVGQPTVSHQLGLLQRRVGVTLYERVGRGVQLTPAGRRLAAAGREVLDAARRGVDQARAEGVDDVLSLAVVSSLAATALPPALAAWRQAEPATDIRIREFLRRDELLEALAHDPTSMALATLPHGWSGPSVGVGWERYALVLPPQLVHLGADGPLDLGRLADVPWVLFDPGHGLHHVVEETCRRAGFSPRPAVRTRQIDTAVRLAGAGLGPALVPAIAVPPELAPLRTEFTPGLRRLVSAFGALHRRPAAGLLAHLTPERTGLEPVGDDTAAP